ncbi:MAG: hypothetical protein WAN11_05070 [Syntrophobacteraceae bacterium]
MRSGRCNLQPLLCVLLAPHVFEIEFVWRSGVLDLSLEVVFAFLDELSGSPTVAEPGKPEAKSTSTRCPPGITYKP